MSPWNSRSDGLDDVDRQILSQLADLYQRIDPPPAGLAARVRAAMADAEPAGDPSGGRELVPAGSRGGRAVHLTGDGLEVWITVAGDDAVVAVDGWFLVTALHTVHLDAGGRRRTTTTDDAGHFTFDAVPRGPIELVVRLGGDGAAPPGEVTFVHDLTG